MKRKYVKKPKYIPLFESCYNCANKPDKCYEKCIDCPCLECSYRNVNEDCIGYLSGGNA